MFVTYSFLKLWRKLSRKESNLRFQVFLVSVIEAMVPLYYCQILEWIASQCIVIFSCLPLLSFLLNLPHLFVFHLLFHLVFLSVFFLFFLTLWQHLNPAFRWPVIVRYCHPCNVNIIDHIDDNDSNIPPLPPPPLHTTNRGEISSSSWIPFGYILYSFSAFSFPFLVLFLFPLLILLVFPLFSYSCFYSYSTSWLWLSIRCIFVLLYG